MTKLALFARLEANPGKEKEVGELLSAALQMAHEEKGTPVWYALRLGDSTFGIFDAFENETDRQAHLEGPIARALMAKASELLATPPVIERVEILGAKV